MHHRAPLDIVQCIPARHRESHKGTHGRLVWVAGSNHYNGAAALMVEGALRARAGVVMDDESKWVSSTGDGS